VAVLAARLREASTYGVPDGSSLADWPIGYDDLEPFYRRAEWEIGVSGSDEPGRRGRVVGVVLVGTEKGRPWRRTVEAQHVILAAGAIESARLLLNSPTVQEPTGIGNSQDQVGRHLQGHAYGGAVGIFADEVEDLVGPGPAIATTDYQHDNPGVVGGGIIVNEFVPTPSNTYRYLVDAGLIPRMGREAKTGMRRLIRRMLRIMGLFQEVTTADARVRVEPAVQDRYKIPVARLSGGPHPEDLRGRDLMSDRAAAWLAATGATKVVPLLGRPTGPSAGQHQAGTCRMGDDPASSFVDP
jgi:choline dehydrogenase-like flavoprotein